MSDNGFGQALAHLRSVADGSGHTKGNLFERLIRSFLKTDRLYANKFDDVWLWKDYPDRDKSVDIGADIVAKEKNGSLCAIQCKFYKDRTLRKSDINSFLEAGSRSEFQHMMLVYVAKGYGKNAQDALTGHQCKVLGFESLASSHIDWPDLAVGLTAVKQRVPHTLWDHQEDAIKAVKSGLEKHDRGQLLMACGTGKTLTSLRLAESVVGKGGLVLYAVPSISLMHQAIRYWSEQRTIQHAYVGVCSDPKVSHGERTEIPIVEMEIGVSTDENKIASAMRKDENKMTVVFTTYQSMEAVMKAQKISEMTFDLVLCDEAHRTTGIESGSSFTLVHRDENVQALKRIYMTATPRVYKAATKTRAHQADKELYSMDDDESSYSIDPNRPVRSKFPYGPVLYQLSFSDAIDKKLLSDYKVIVLGVNEEYGGRPLQKLVDTTDAGDLNLTDSARMLGLYRVLENPDPENGVRPLQTAIIYTNRIRDSLTFANSFDDLTLEAGIQKQFGCDARHVDGKQNATRRADALQWLRDSQTDASKCRIVSNARCLSEGVDVPSLDAISFLNPKSSEVEIIQAVGRVMRKSEGKNYGYVIIPIGIPPGAKSETILNEKKTFETIWKVLRALRSHDSQMGVEANTVDLKKRMLSKVKWIGIDREGKRRDSSNVAETYPLGELDVPADALYSCIVEEVGDRQYFEHWAKDVADVVPRIQKRIRMVVSDGQARTEFDSYMTGLREIIHDGLTEHEGIEMLAQHMVTRRIFNAMFGSDDFARQNPVSSTLDGVLDNLRAHGLDTELKDLEGFYRSIEQRIKGLDTHDARQPVISELYGTFFKKAFPKMADRLGIVYTPTEIVDFILRSVDHVLRENFGCGLTDENVNIIDPFTGAGTFIARLISKDLGLIHDGDLARKYHNELFASEIVLLAYYIAAVNCESVYGQRTGIFEQFDGLSLMDTFNLGRMDEHTGDIMAGPKRRIRWQREAKITVVVGNPPWSAGQKSANEDNRNVSYPEMERMVANTYIKRAPKGNKRALYNSYVMALRRASDRIKGGGVIGFVTPSSYLTGNSEAGIRACLEDEFTDVWCYNLRGDAMKSGEDRRREGDNMFGVGTRQGIAITILVKNPKKTGCTIHVNDIGDYLKVQKKSEKMVRIVSLAGISDWEMPRLNKYHEWVDPRGDEDEEFEKLTPMGTKEAKSGKGGNVLFGMYSRGLATSRDPWAYNTSKKELEKNMRRHIYYCNEQDLDNFVINPKQAKKNSSMIERMKKLGGKAVFDKDKIRTALYRPFLKQYLYFDPVFVHEPTIVPPFFPHGDSKNPAILVQDKAGKFSSLVVDMTPDLNNIPPSQCFPFRVKNDIGRNVRPADLQPPTSNLQPPTSNLQPPTENLAIIVPDKIKGEFSVFITDITPDLEVVHHSQVFPMKVMEK